MNIDTNNLPLKIEARIIRNCKANISISAYQRLQNLANEYQQKYSNTSIGDIPRIQDARSFFRAVGIDPTKRRPSSEALLRRAITGKDLYQINNIVDVANWCSLEFLLPICVYDYSKIIGEVSVRIGTPKDSYLALNKREMNFEDKFVICDKIGAFGSPLTDSLRTAVSSSTTDLFIVIFAPIDYDSDLLKLQIRLMKDRIIEFRK